MTMESAVSIWNQLNIFERSLLLEIPLALLVAAHAIMFKRDPRSSIYWTVLILTLPWLGMCLYLLFGINRIQRQAPALSATQASVLGEFTSCDAIEILQDGDEAYPRMLAEIANAEGEILLSTYIFDTDEAGRAFVEALTQAVSRGVEVRVLVDGVGIWYSLPRVTRLLRRARIPHAIFLPTFNPGSVRFLNLRNHRKLLLVDRRVAFLGGMNIRVGHWLSKQPGSPVRDLHFLMSGAVVGHLIEQFRSDWFSADRGCHPVAPVPRHPAVVGEKAVAVRVLADGPDLVTPRFLSLVLMRIAEARQRILIVTPYFLPDSVLISALCTAALRGVSVEILVPARNNLPWMRWAMYAQSWQLLQQGVRIHEGGGSVFDHSKIFIVDDNCSVIGSSNWDARSFRLNFEINVELDCQLWTERLAQVVARKLESAKPLLLQEVEARSTAVRLRDGIARLFLPLL